MDRFFKELRRRNVVRVAGVYAIIAGIVVLGLVIVLKEPDRTTVGSGTTAVAGDVAGAAADAEFDLALETSPNYPLAIAGKALPESENQIRGVGRDPASITNR